MGFQSHLTYLLMRAISAFYRAFASGGSKIPSDIVSSDQQL
ncbi:hypothetical protein FHT28_005171 [Rhizobium sp. SG570]|nr:hypothetical protein [Rhizobium sp. SG570]